MADIIDVSLIKDKDKSEELNVSHNISNSSSAISNTKDSSIRSFEKENGQSTNDSLKGLETEKLKIAPSEKIVLGVPSTQMEIDLQDKPENKHKNSNESNENIESIDCDSSDNCKSVKAGKSDIPAEKLVNNDDKLRNSKISPDNNDVEMAEESSSSKDCLKNDSEKCKEKYQNGESDEVSDLSMKRKDVDVVKENKTISNDPPKSGILKLTSNIASTKEEKETNSDNDVHIIDSDDDDEDDEEEEDPLKGATSEPDFKSNNVESGNTYVIQSDSDSEEQSESNQNQKSEPTTNNDDDDCVLIEDDDDEKPNEVSNLKLKHGQNSEHDDDLQPPHKRSRMVGVNETSPFSSNQLGKLSIKEARSLSEMKVVNNFQSYMPNNTAINPAALAANAFANKNGKPLSYPTGINQDSAISQFNQIPKLGPASLIPNSGILGTNPNLLPALTDDMFVLEAPSFIVPYIYEKPPETNLRETIVKIKSEIDLPEKSAVEESDTELAKLEKIKSDEKSENKDSSKSTKKSNKDTSGDDSWNESDDSEDDDSSDENRTKILIKDAETDLNLIKQAIAPPNKLIQTQTSAADAEKKCDTYFESPLGRFFIDIGIDLVQEYVQSDLLKIQKRKLRKVSGAKELNEVEISISALSKNLEASKKRNMQFRFSLKRCEFCNFKTESALSMAHHYETPHMEKNLYKCNFCTFEIRQTQEILFHMEAVHNIKGRLEKALSYHQCPNCPFEDNGKSKIARHQPVCVKKFRPEVNLGPPNDWEAPAKIPKIKPKHGLVGTATAYQAMAAQAAAQKAALVTLQQQQQAARNLLVSNNSNRNKKPPPPRVAPIRAPAPQVLPRTVPIPLAAPRQSLPQGTILANTYNIVKNNPLVQAQNQKRISGQPSISITPLPRQVSAPNSSVSQINPTNIPKTVAKSGQPGNKSSFVICEICDGYIKDLEQLRNHMQWMHKVKIHPKMIFNRPPLNCQKCQFRFFTDQGLERHLLGSHGLVTSSMQDAANKGKDAGRCPVCGRVYQWKLLNHVSRDHNMTLKPAHLSYKCTVCTATFGMYKEFENHVYTAHSTVAKKSVDVKKGNTSNNNNSINPQRPSASTCNESLLKPLRINDEITIIPQGATKKL